MTDMSFSPHGRLVVTASTDNTTWLWDTETWRNLTVLSGHTNAVRSAAFSNVEGVDGRKFEELGASSATWSIPFVALSW